MKKIIFLLLLCLLLPTASGSTDTLTVQDARAEDAGAVADVTILKLLAEAGRRPAPFFALDADRVRLEVDRSDFVVETVQRTYLDPYTTRSEHHRARIVGLQNGEEARWTLDGWPSHAPPTIEVTASCLTLQPADRAVEITRTIVRRDERPDRTTNLTTSLRPDSCGEDLAVTIRGDFRLSLWDWSAHLTDEAGTQTIETGIREAQGGVAKQGAEAYLFATNGTLTLTVDRPSAFYVNNARVDARILTLHGATGILQRSDSTQALDGEDVTLRDVHDVQFVGAGVGQPLLADVAPAGGLVPAAQGPEPPLGASSWAWPLAAAAAVAASIMVRQRPLAYVAWSRCRGHDLGTWKPGNRRERRGLGYWIMAKAAHRLRLHRLSLRHAKRAYALYPDQPEVRLMLATALSHCRRDAQALVHYLAAAGLLRGRKRAQALHGAATSNANLGSHDAAVDRYMELFQADPDYARERLGHVARSPLYNHPRFVELRRQLDVRHHEPGVA